MVKLSECDLMINRLHLQRWKLTLFTAVCALVLESCASRGVQLVHPQSGATVRCGAAGTGIMAGSAESFVEDCIRNYEGKGYVAVDKLSLEQRADMEKRGILPKQEPPPRMGY